ncbi:hypothetical protein AB0C07_29345 [Actinoplanes missouriensis]|uniref:YunG family protein n=1 Tax=Actinoplanes missouriensis TaxID=1866 RepID=UPI0033C2CFCB
MHTVETLEPIVRASWDADTCDPHDLPWRPDNPERGQCGVTALVLHDLLGGDLVMGEVFEDGRKVGHHWWNRLPDGREVDLTAAQFHPTETVTAGRVRHRPPGPPRRCRAQYELLSSRVARHVNPASGGGADHIAPGEARG